jgi:hypothetical protein
VEVEQDHLEEEVAEQAVIEHLVMGLHHYKEQY